MAAELVRKTTDSDVETTPGSSPRLADDADAETTCRVTVKSTFIELTDGLSMMQRYKKIRKMKTDSALTEGDSDEELVLTELAQRTVQAEAKAVHAEGTQLKALLESPCASPEPAAPRQPGGRTTVMLRNIPNNYTRQMLLSLLDEQGFKGRFDFLYLPCDFQRDSNLGYAFVNLIDEETVELFWSCFDGFSDWSLPTAKVGQVKWSGPHQGLEEHVERYRNSPVMHRSVPEEYKPVMFSGGVQVPFPAPTKRLKAPARGTR
mmetsp:Transcript_52042/g.97350  ORF Transcript_52042/g.97350 Transcript_52042/m.97350 type:complete len:262 (-) Transcript_52042:284-1069(-)